MQVFPHYFKLSHEGTFVQYSLQQHIGHLPMFWTVLQWRYFIPMFTFPSCSFQKFLLWFPLITAVYSDIKLQPLSLITATIYIEQDSHLIMFCLSLFSLQKILRSLMQKVHSIPSSTPLGSSSAVWLASQCLQFPGATKVKRSLVAAVRNIALHY